MLNKFAICIACIAAAAVPSAAVPATMGFNLRATVKVHCDIQHQSTDFSVSTTGAVSLGVFREYCNAPGGYNLVLVYEPGSLRGARIFAGEDVIELNGSGIATLSRVSGPRNRQRPISVIPGLTGFDTDRLDLRLIPLG